MYSLKRNGNLFIHRFSPFVKPYKLYLLASLAGYLWFFTCGVSPHILTPQTRAKLHKPHGPYRSKAFINPVPLLKKYSSLSIPSSSRIPPSTSKPILTPQKWFKLKNSAAKFHSLVHTKHTNLEEDAAIQHFDALANLRRRKHLFIRHFKNLKQFLLQKSQSLKHSKLWKRTMWPISQSIVAVALYAVHMLILSKTVIPFPVQIIPNDLGLFQSIGSDSLAGLITISSLFFFKYFAASPSFTSNFSSVETSTLWEIPRKSGRRVATVITLLMLAYLASGHGALLVEWSLYLFSAAGIPLSIAMHRSLQVLLGHLLWVWMGCFILSNGLFPFFPPIGKWYRLDWSHNWLWWVISGYYASHLLFNVADFVNQFLLPVIVTLEPSESIVSKMINPENNDILALLIGAVAPCISAPWWEEVLYRGFTLPALTLCAPVSVAIPLSALLFAAHHMSMQSMLPLTTLGFAWAILYVYSRNLLVTVLIHAMWNSRIFLGSLLGI